MRDRIERFAVWVVEDGWKLVVACFISFGFLLAGVLCGAVGLPPEGQPVHAALAVLSLLSLALFFFSYFGTLALIVDFRTFPLTDLMPNP